MVSPYCPDRGDLIWVNFEPQSGREITKRRPALVLSSKEYNSSIGLCIGCPISTKSKTHQFNIPISVGRTASYVKSDQIKSLDWRTRNAAFIAKAPRDVLLEVLENLQLLLFDA